MTTLVCRVGVQGQFQAAEGIRVIQWGVSTSGGPFRGVPTMRRAWPHCCPHPPSIYGTRFVNVQLVLDLSRPMSGPLQGPYCAFTRQMSCEGKPKSS